MVEKTKEALKNLDFKNIMKTATKIIKAVNQMFDDDEETDFAIEGEFRKMRTLRKRRMPSELHRDDRIDDPVDSYRVEVFRRVINQITTSIVERFSNNYELVTDTACVDPHRLQELRENGLPPEALKNICNRLSLNKQKLSNELQSFIVSFDSLSKSLNEEYATTRQLESEHILQTHFDVISGSHCTSGKSCRNCLLCCFRILFKYSLHASAYSNLFLVYKYLLTWSFTQVSCERAFSKLKIVKARLRSSLSNEPLGTFMLMSIEKDLHSNISEDDIIPFLVKNLTQFSRLLAV